MRCPRPGNDSGEYAVHRRENRFRLHPREHWINPVLYVEFENISGADKSLLGIVSHDGRDDLIAPVTGSRQETKRELETELILGTYFTPLAACFEARKGILQVMPGRHIPRTAYLLAA